MFSLTLIWNTKKEKKTTKNNGLYPTPSGLTQAKVSLGKANPLWLATRKRGFASLPCASLGEPSPSSEEARERGLPKGTSNHNEIFSMNGISDSKIENNFQRENIVIITVPSGETQQPLLPFGTKQTPPFLSPSTRGIETQAKGSSLNPTKRINSAFSAKSLSGRHTQPEGIMSDSSSSFKQGGLSRVVSITYEEIGLFPRSFSRVLDRFLKQVFSDVENLVIQEYRFYRYLFLTTLKCLFIFIFVPVFINFLAKTYIVRPLTEYFWNTKQTEIFLNYYQQKRAFAELKDFEEKIYFESLIYPKSAFSFHSQNKINKQELPSLTDSLPLWPSAGSPSSLVLSPSPSGDASLGEPRCSRGLPEGVYPKGNPEGLDCSEAHLSLRKVKVDEATPLTRREKNPKWSETLLVSTKAHERNHFYEPINYQADTESLINSYNLKSSLFVYQTKEADKNIQQRYQEKTIELAQRYNDESIEAITNFFADFISLCSLFYLFYALEIQINITKSFLLEVFFGLDDSKKSLLILLVTDLLVGYHSSNLWELFFESFFHHYGLPESQTGIFLLVATLPVLLDVLFKYLIFRHLNRSSPATVATYHAMIE